MALKILSAGSMLHGLRECIAVALADFGVIEVATNHGHHIHDAVMRGTATADVVLLPAGLAAALQHAGHVCNSVALGTVGIGGAVRIGSPVPPIDTMANLKTAILAADAVLLTRAPTGDHLITVVAELGLTETVAPKLLRFDTSSQLNNHLAARLDKALGFGPETEIRAGRGVTWIGDVPQEIQIALPYVAATLTQTKAPDLAGAFLEFLATERARRIFHHSGVR